MVYEGVKLQVLFAKKKMQFVKNCNKRGVLRIATKEFFKMLPKCFGRPSQELDSVNSFQN